MFSIDAQDGLARTGSLKTAHGTLRTPCFKAVATKSAVKMMSSDGLKEIGQQAVISNAFILSLRPGLEVIRAHGGLHSFMDFDRTIYTDSGGFQILSLGDEFHVKTTDKGLSFRSPFDGSHQTLSPKSCMQIQQTLGSDVAMALDHMPLYGSTKEQAIESLKHTHDWMQRCKKIHTGESIYGKRQLLFGIAQGGVYPDLRLKSIRFIDSLDFDGIAFGGLAVGEPKEKMFEMIDLSSRNCSEEKPRYVMGLGSPEDIVKAVDKGVDTFDSIFPTRNARHGHLFTSDGVLRIENAAYRQDYGPIDNDCSCKICKKYTRSYIHHLLRTREPLGKMLATYHNLYFMQDLVKKIQKAIQAQEFSDFKKEFLARYQDAKAEDGSEN